MSKPNSTTPVVIVQNVLREIAPWFKQHSKELREELDIGFDGEKQAKELETSLNKTQDKFVQEQGEDREVTDERNATIVEVRTLYRSVFSSVKRRSKQPGASNRMVTDFQIGQPSRIRSITDAQSFLASLGNKISLHKDALAEGKDRTGTWLKRIQSLETKFNKITADRTRETRETTQARKERDEIREKAVSFIDDMCLTAESVLEISEKPFDDLINIFETQNPETPSQAISSAPVETAPPAESEQATPA